MSCHVMSCTCSSWYGDVMVVNTPWLYLAEVEASDEDLEHRTLGRTLPEVLFSLDASDGFLKERVMNLPQEVVEGTHNTEEGTVKVLSSGVDCPSIVYVWPIINTVEWTVSTYIIIISECTALSVIG